MNDQYLQKIDELLQKRLKENYKDFVTKTDLEVALKDSATQITEDISDVVTKLIQQIEEKKADKAQTLPLEVRVDNLEKHLHN